MYAIFQVLYRGKVSFRSHFGSSRFGLSGLSCLASESEFRAASSRATV
jgi:hypothetical protein